MKRDDIVEVWREDLKDLEEYEPVITSVRDMNNLIRYIDFLHGWIFDLTISSQKYISSRETLCNEYYFMEKRLKK